ncbi:hypothetical protein [Streptomyces sp. NPDC059009]|uniref:hypothetical protein n=1 Tax=Streptomyces sp. NPDC059009 TaxID=3346694 RepID=UPI0036BC71C0
MNRHDVVAAAATPATASVRPDASAYASLRRILALDAGGTLAFGLAYVVAAGPLAGLLGVSDALLLTSGALMLAIGAGAAALARCPQPPRAAVKLFVAVGIAWAAVSAASLAFDWWDPNGLGVAWTVVQTIPVAVFAVLQITWLRAS